MDVKTPDDIVNRHPRPAVDIAGSPVLDPANIARPPEPFMSAEEAIKSDFWNFVQFEIVIDKDNALRVRTGFKPLTVDLIIPAEARASYAQHGATVQNRVMQSLENDIAELLCVTRYKLGMELDKKAKANAKL